MHTYAYVLTCDPSLTGWILKYRLHYMYMHGEVTLWLLKQLEISFFPLLNICSLYKYVCVHIKEKAAHF